MTVRSSPPRLSDDALRRLRDAAELPEPDPSRYLVLERVGRGGMGTVYRARDVLLKRDVALKVLHVGADSGDLAARLTQEARTLARLEHPGIVPVHDVGVLADGRPFYTMKLVHGHPLDDVVRGRRQPDLLRLFIRICEPMAFAHSRGIVHRDVKPQNVMVGEFGEVLVLDWGISKWASIGDALDTTAPGADAGVDTAAGAIVGTRGYMAPEQARGESASVDARADVYSLGMLLTHMLSLGSTRGMPRPLSAILRKATSVEPAVRYADAEALAKDVLRFLAAERVQAHRENILEQTLRLYRRHRILVLIVAAYLVVRLVLILWQATTTP
ncbi:MAG: serine/threonine-protein kinase [Gemmatimonadaceae bacterium]